MTASRHALRAKDVRHSLRIITLAWVFGAAWQWAVSGAALTQFAQEGLHMPDGAFGLLAMMPLVAGLVQIPAGLLVARFGHRRAVFLVGTTFSRLAWTAMAAIPWVLPHQPAWWYPLLIGMVLISWVGVQAGSPGWMNWMSEIIPFKVRGRYFAVRNRIGLVTGVAVTILVGLVMDRVNSPQVMLKVTSLVIAVAGIVGAIDPLYFLAISDHESPPKRPETSLTGFLLEPLGDRSFRWYLLFTFTMNVSYVALGQYIWLYLFNVVRMSNTLANTLLQAVPPVCMAATYGWWGRLIDRVGRRPVLVVCTVLSVLAPAGWLVVSPGNVWIGYAVTVPTYLSWAGMEVANFNLLLNMSGSTHDRHGAACVALTAAAACAGGILSGLLGGAIAVCLPDWRYLLGVLGVALTYHSLIFVFTAVARVLAIWMAARIVEPESHDTRRVIRYMTSSIYSNVKQFMALPGWPWD